MGVRTADLRQLRAFSVLAQELHFGRAATRLAITQPALSQLVRDLEARVGVPLLERTTRRVSLTPAGMGFLADVDDILHRLQGAVDRARDSHGLSTERLRVGAGLFTTFSMLPGLLRRFRQRYPTVKVEVEILGSAEIVRAIERGELDIGLLRPPAEPGRLHVETLLEEGFLAVMAEDHPLAGRRRISLADLAAQEVLRLSRPDLRDAFNAVDRQLEDAGLTLDRCMITHSTLNALALVSATGGISIVPAWASAGHWAGLAFRKVEDLTATIDLAIAWSADRRDAAIFNFAEAATRTVASIPPSR